MPINNKNRGNNREKKCHKVQQFISNKISPFLRFCFFLMLFILLWLTYNQPILEWTEENVFPLFAKWKPCNWIAIVCWMTYLILFALYIIPKFQNRYVLSYKHLAVIGGIITLYVWFRLSNDYCLVPFWGRLTYVGVFVVLPIAIILLCHFYGKLNQWFRHSNNDGSNSLLLDDFPLYNNEDDEFDYNDSAISFANEIKALPKKEHSWSIAITSPWGGGKTSMINLIKENLKDSFIFVDFNPRSSASSNIQADFFCTLLGIVQDYNAQLKPLLNDYVSSLAAIDKTGIASICVNKLRDVNNSHIKEKLNDCISTLPKPLLIFFDDFDRLTESEMIEVLKLIGINASFKNAVFLTALDKKYANSIINNQKVNDVSFVDKYFQVEYSVPYRPYLYTIKFLKKCLSQVAKSLVGSKYFNLDRTLENNSDILQKFILTPRDCKRFANMLAKDYERVYNEVNGEEFLLLRLIKYKYPDEYDKLYRKVYLKKADIDNWSIGMLESETKLLEQAKSKVLIEHLFPSKLTSDDWDSYLFRSIRNEDSFDNYFCSEVYNALQISEIKEILHAQNKADIQAKFNALENNINKINDVISYIWANWGIMTIQDEEDLIHRYLVLISLIDLIPQSKMQLHSRLCNLINLHTINSLNSKHIKYDIKRLKSEFNNSFSSMQSESGVVLILYIINYVIEDTVLRKPKENIILDDDDLQKMRGEFWHRYLKEIPLFEEKAMGYLYKCMDGVVFNSDCMREAKTKIEQNPSWYLSAFVRPGGPENGNAPMIFHEALCKKIWGGNEGFKNFLFSPELDKYQYTTRCRNYWKLLEANDYEDLIYDHPIDVQKLINNDFAQEAKDLEQLQKFDKELRTIINSEATSRATYEKYESNYARVINNVKEIKLPVKLRDCVINNIQEADKKLKKLDKEIKYMTYSEISRY